MNLNVAPLHVPPRYGACPGHQTPEPLICFGRVRQHEQLVRAVKTHQIAVRSAAIEQAAQPQVGEHPLDEVIAEPRIGQPTFFLDGQVRIRLGERRGEQPASAAGRTPVSVVDLHPLESAAGRIFLEHVARQISAASVDTRDRE